MSGCVLQKLISSGEYDEIEDIVTIEGEFVETGPDHVVTRQVFLGMTPRNLLIACRQLVDFKLNPDMVYDTSVDLDTDGMEIASVWPLCVIQMAYPTSKYTLTISMYHVTRYYEMTNTHLNGDLEETWARWQERVYYLREDPYHYIRDLYDEYNLPYPNYYLTREEKSVKRLEDKSVKRLEKKSVNHLEEKSVNHLEEESVKRQAEKSVKRQKGKIVKRQKGKIVKRKKEKSVKSQPPTEEPAKSKPQPTLKEVVDEYWNNKPVPLVRGKETTFQVRSETEIMKDNKEKKMGSVFKKWQSITKGTEK